ncbi:S8 family peptidase [Xanthobacteraceae bacterium Astr-EGSB]|uniref:S8 family peptidase n=1 Tax=Astrobacterium formosum TaxID=3069710 RepID=UPI0027ADE17B|nr:S8 family peptidase [Xanthobacteraceae bacterium Astr-EGSB]
MAKLPHLLLERLDKTLDRRKPPPPPARPARDDVKSHAASITAKIDAATSEQMSLPKIEGIDPELILKVNLSSSVQEDAWRTAGFKILAQEPNGILVLFSDDTELKSFRQRLAEYQKGTQVDAKRPAYNHLFAAIDDVGSITPPDRIGFRMRAEGKVAVSDFEPRANFTVDIELWDAPTHLDRQVRVQNVVAYIGAAGGEILSRYVGTAGLIILRARMRGALLRDALALPVVARVDLPPVPDLGERDPPFITLDDMPAPAPAWDAPLIGIIDSGSTDHPFLAPSLVESIGVPATLGTADIWGHGTKVAGIAAFGDVRECVSRGTFESPVRIISVKVVSDQGQFDDAATIPEQMEAAIRVLHERGCRVINISLGDKLRIPYDGGRVSPWAAVLDTLARELDVVIIVSAGNSANGHRAPWGPQAEQITQTYPAYLVSSENRIVDPATAAIALTVGSVAHANGLPDGSSAGAELRTIASLNMPTPVTRSGPGVNDSIKPELIDYGGNVLFDGMTQRIVTGDHYASAGMLTLRPDYIQGLLTSSTGTSMAAPRIAYKAALLIRAMPQASANMIRALLGLSASPPTEALECLQRLGGDAQRACLGYGVPDIARVLDSEERRVVLIADRQELATDQFALYRVPLPKEFQTTKGERYIRVSLAFDPPVRHTRFEYLGLRLNYHLIRGMKPEAIFEHFRRRAKDEAPFEKLAASSKCELQPSRDLRATSTLQKSTFKMARNIDRYGDDYFLAVFAERRWAGEDITHQRFAVAVELEHEAQINVHQQLRVRLRV